MDWFAAKDGILQWLIPAVGLWVVHELRRLTKSVETLNIEMAVNHANSEAFEKRLTRIEKHVFEK